MRDLDPTRGRPVDPFGGFLSGQYYNEEATAYGGAMMTRATDSVHSNRGYALGNQRLQGVVTALASSGTTRQYFAQGIWRDNLVVYGGTGDYQLLTFPVTMQFYHIPSNTWSTIAPCSLYPGKIRGCATEVVGDTMYMIGGYNPDRTTAHETWKFNFLMKQWTRLQDIPLPGSAGYFDYMATSVVGNYIYVFSGYYKTGSTQNYPNIIRFNILSETWETLVSTVGTTPGWFGALAINYNGQIFLIGGKTPSGTVLNTNIVVPTSFADTTTVAKATMANTRQYLFGFRFNDLIYVFGGAADSGEVYNIRCNRWAAHGISLPTYRFATKAHFYKGAMYFHAGSDGGTNVYQTTYRIE